MIKYAVFQGRIFENKSYYYVVLFLVLSCFNEFSIMLLGKWLKKETEQASTVCLRSLIAPLKKRSQSNET